METLSHSGQVETIREAFAYMERFKGETFVLKIDDALLDNPVFPILVRDMVLLHRMGIRMVLVPGTRHRTDELLSQYGIRCRTVKGVRVSTPEAMPFIRMAAFDISNRLMTILAENGTTAIIGNWTRARGLGVVDGVNYRDTGVVDKLQVETVRNALAEGLIPIFPSIGWNAQGKPYNVSSNELATTVSRLLGAAKLFFVTTHAGVVAERYRLPEGINETGLISQLALDQARRFLDLNEVKSDEVIEMVSLAYEACRDGVRRVHIVDGRVDGVLLKEIFSNLGVGTMVHANQFDNIRSMVRSDIPEVLRIMQPLVERGVLVSRTAADLEDSIEQFVVYELDGTVHACGALIPAGDRVGEIAGIAVDEPYVDLGIGKRIVQYLLARARAVRMTRVVALTTRAADWFLQMGFIEGTPAALPESRRSRYNRRRNSQVLVYRVGGRGTGRRPRDAG